MKLYNANAGNPKRVRIFIAEKGVDIPRVDLEAGSDTRTEEFRKINSLQELPVLELDDGSIITESVAICRYLEARFPEPPLMGRDAFDKVALRCGANGFSINCFSRTVTMCATPSLSSKMWSGRSQNSPPQNARSFRKDGSG